MDTLYKKEDLELPYNIDSRFFKFVQDGETKEKYEQRWVVLTEEVNSFIEALPISYESLALSDVSREDRGPLTIVTANYGDMGLSEDYDGDGELSWWTLSSGVYTYHIKRWVDNNENAIKAFCEYCMSSFGYSDEEVSVHCNPIAGEPRVMCEGTFTPNDDFGGDGGDSGFNDDEADENGLIEDSNGIQFNTSINSMTVPVRSYVSHKLGIDLTSADRVINLVSRIDNGELVYKKQGTYGVQMPAESGWYLTDDNPQALQNPPEVREDTICTPSNVADCRLAMNAVPEAQFISIKVTATTTVKSRDKLTTTKLQNKFNETGKVEEGTTAESAGGAYNPNNYKPNPEDPNKQGEYIEQPNDIPGSNGGLGITKNPEIEIGKTKMTIPKNCWVATDPEGHTYPLNCSWVNEGVSFDATTVKSHYSTDRRVYYQGTMVQSYGTISSFSNLMGGQNASGAPCSSSTSSQSI